MCCYDAGPWSGRSPIAEPCPRCAAPGYVDPFAGLIPLRTVQRFRRPGFGVLCMRKTPGQPTERVIVWKSGLVEPVHYDSARNRWLNAFDQVICWIVGRKIGPMRRVLAQARDAQADR